jgi:hypothetical protein
MSRLISKSGMAENMCVQVGVAAPSLKVRMLFLLPVSAAAILNLDVGQRRKMSVNKKCHIQVGSSSGSRPLGWGGGEFPQSFSSPPIFRNERQRREILVPRTTGSRSAICRSGGGGGSGSTSPPPVRVTPEKIFENIYSVWCILVHFCTINCLYGFIRFARKL